ncbi:class I SAM-dependent methyltransferase [Lysobacter enzymogenes]|uniref:S-adenosyl-L-methionine-dependent methyltransferase n=1 Tax=Lysobacter enzymogenes TaxID=69 RepID=A0A3N2RFJ4_LYSEN|nr:class I SAM-dependent methyltransferase [Lysobacter enzymogenes]ROU06198.1 hypothetical protein D9T17_14725 [Lysobacter enzymogenes]
MDRVSTSMLLAAAAVRQARSDADPSDTDPAVSRNAALARACLQGCGRPGARLLWAVDHAPGRVLLAALETLYLPGIGAHYAWRKRRIRRWALRACGDGARQLLVLGAGFDGLSLFLLERIPGLRAFEIERESTVAIKREALRRLGVREPRLGLVAADLSVVAVEALLPDIPRFDPRLPTLVVAEGVLMYLDPPELQRLLRGLAQTLPGAGLIATAMAPAAAGAPGFARQRSWVRRWLQRAGEPFRWAQTRDGLAATLAAASVRLERIADPDEAADPDPSPGEWLFAGEFARPPR